MKAHSLPVANPVKRQVSIPAQGTHNMLGTYSVCAMRIDICTVLCAQCIQRFVGLILAVSPARLKTVLQGKNLAWSEDSPHCLFCLLLYFLLFLLLSWIAIQSDQAKRALILTASVDPRISLCTLPKLPGLFVLLSAKPRQKAGVISSFRIYFEWPFTAPDCQISGLKGAHLHTRLQTVYSPVL